MIVPGANEAVSDHCGVEAGFVMRVLVEGDGARVQGTALYYGRGAHG